MQQTIEERLAALESVVISKSEVKLVDPENPNIAYKIKVENGNLQTIKEVTTISVSTQILDEITQS